jgi:epoxyqueuosine reductase
VDFHSILLKCAVEEGFPLAGALDIDTVLGGELKAHVERYDEWLGKEYEGAMSYLRRGRDRRADPRIVFPEAQSILCVAMPYPVLPAGEMDPSKGPRYARYLRRQDYHDEMAEKLERVMKCVANEWNAQAAKPSSSKPLAWKVCVDTSAVLERSWAALAGLGWIGKNSLLIHPQYGSYLFLGEVLISELTGKGPQPIKNYCGNCTRCLDSCPTGAFVKPGMLDSKRCIAYSTLEKRGSLAELDEKQKRAIGTWIAGCDVCQEVCPFNTKSVRAAQTSGEADKMPVIDAATSLREWRALLEETQDQYKARIKDSSLNRVKPGQFSRNLAITLGNAIIMSGDPTWADELRELVTRRVDTETDLDARVEWVRCFKLLK